ncbi:hypothetical protein OLMES_4872 [Oleiphilus messinensis]|uniref:Uncharacterized protein n=1 Tax=Oleiphilus messinensis TaxID=141451 RepID=A0A1Y0IF26_9GAMM|nr:hypothetical protein [Oleiphilus messinensis]ARU58860.1 hypothetical protein OLMES_4872 [Oleiphilus messinensis]
MKKTTLITTTSLCMLIGSQAVSAQNITIIPQLAVQYKNLDFDQKIKFGFKPSDGSGTRERLNEDYTGGFEAQIPTLSASLTGYYSGMFVTLKYDSNVTETQTDSTVGFTNGPTDVDRSDISLTVGYNIVDNLNIFGGYMRGQTELTPEPGYVDDIEGSQQFYLGCVFSDDSSIPCTPPVFSNLAKDHEILGLEPYKQEYEENGWFVGASYGVALGSGNLSFSIAYALMQGEYRDNYLQGVVEADSVFKGDSKGLSLGVTWREQLSDTTGYFIDLRRQEYDMDADDEKGLLDNEFGVPLFEKTETEERMTTLTAGLHWYF